MDTPHPERIVVARFDRMGDMILGANLLVELERAFPQTEIVICCRPEVCSLRELLPARLVWKPVPLRIEGDLPPSYLYEEVVPFLNEIHNLSHEILIVASYQRVWLDGLMTAVTKAPHRIGFRTEAPLTVGFDELVKLIRITGRPDLSAEIECERDTTELEKSRRLTEFMVKRPLTLSRPALRVPAGAMEAGARLAESLFPRKGRERRIVFWPGSSEGLRKSMTPAMWGRVARWLRWRGFGVAILGGPGDAETLDVLRSEFRRPAAAAIRALGRDELPVLGGLLAQVRAMVGTDSGPAHLAQAVECPSLVVTGGGTWPRFNAMFGPAAVVTVPVSCRGCNWICPFDSFLCVSLIRFQEIRNGLKWLLRQRRGHNEVRYFEDARDDVPWLPDATAAGGKYLDALHKAHDIHEDQNRLRARVAALQRELTVLRREGDVEADDREGVSAR